MCFLLHLPQIFYLNTSYLLGEVAPDRPHLQLYVPAHVHMYFISQEAEKCSIAPGGFNLETRILMESYSFWEQMWLKIMQIKAFLIDSEIKMYEAEKPNNEVNCVVGRKERT